LVGLSLSIDTWTALGSLGMTIMFVALILSYYNFLIGPQGKGPNVVVDIDALMYQNLSISGVPGLILAGVAFGMRKADLSQSTSLILLVTGAILIVGMVFALSMVERINADFLTQNIVTIPRLFVIAGAGVMVIGAILYKDNLSKRKRKPRNFDKPS